MKSRKSTKAKPSPEPAPDYGRHMVTTELTMRRIQLQVAKFATQYRCDPHSFMRSIDHHAMEDAISGNMVQTLVAKVAMKKLDVKTVKFPHGPWQFLKFELIGSKLYALSPVRWFLKKYPVRYIEITMEANAYHPDIAIPDHATFVEIYTQARYANA
jgi:hypothetical protein